MRHSTLLAVLNVVLPEMRVARGRRGRTFKVVYIVFVEAALVLVSTTVLFIPAITTEKGSQGGVVFLAHLHPLPVSWSVVACLMLMGAILLFLNTFWFGPNMNLFLFAMERERRTLPRPFTCLPKRVDRLSPAQDAWLEVEKGLE